MGDIVPDAVRLQRIDERCAFGTEPARLCIASGVSGAAGPAQADHPQAAVNPPRGVVRRLDRVRAFHEQDESRHDLGIEIRQIPNDRDPACRFFGFVPAQLSASGAFRRIWIVGGVCRGFSGRTIPFGEDGGKEGLDAGRGEIGPSDGAIDSKFSYRAVEVPTFPGEIGKIEMGVEPGMFGHGSMLAIPRSLI